jgi:hypothetical protein
VTVPRCCRWGISEEGFVHFWLEHADDDTKDRVTRLAEKNELWRRWWRAALAAEAAR